MEKSSDESPTDQEHRPGDRADQAHRVQLTARSISFGCVIVDEISFRSCLLFVRKAYSTVVYSCHSSSSDLCCRHHYLLKRSLFVCESASYPIVSHKSEYGTFPYPEFSFFK